MTIPTRPAPPPPQVRNFNGSAAAADANASLEQLRLQLQQQQQQQKITIKLPPPPKGHLSSNITTTSTFPMKSNHNNNGINHFDYDGNVAVAGEGSSITRKFPKARYAPTTNWDDTPFAAASTATKKVPPPRPPPPKVIVNGQAKATGGNSHATTLTSTNILTNIFHRKKTSTTSTAKATTNNNKLAKQNSAARVYGLSSGNYVTNTTETTSSSSSSNVTNSSIYDAGFANADWNAAWNTTTSNASSYFATTTATTSSSSTAQEGQLISFDSPPSSPTFTQKSNSDCLSVDSFSSDSNFSSPQNGSVSQPESGFEDDFSAAGSQQSRSRPTTTSPMDPWGTFDAFGNNGAVAVGASGAGFGFALTDNLYCSTATIGTAPVRNLNTLNMRTNTTHATTQDNPLCNGKSLLPPAPSINMPTIIKPKISQKPKAPKPPVFNLVKQQQQELSNGNSSSHLPTPPSPPMPQCAPPPPPSILDVISGKADALQLAGDSQSYNMNSTADDSPHGIALFSFEGAEEGDLCFREGEKIYLLEKASDEWYRGRTRAGCEGLLPANYIDVKVPLKTQNDTNVAATTNKNQTTLPKVRCLYDFPAEIDGDLGLKENDLVTILYRINEDWLFGEMNNRQGQFPANFLEYIPPNIPLP